MIKNSISIIVLFLLFISSNLVAARPTSVAARPTSVAARPTSSKQSKASSIIESNYYKIGKVEVTGLKKIEKDAVLAKIKSIPGARFSREQVASDIRELFAMKLFTQVEVLEDNVAGSLELTFVITEKPTMNEIVFEGNSELKAEDLMTQSGLKTFEVVNYARIKDAEIKLVKHYEDKGYYLTKITSVIEELVPGESARLKFIITENDKVKVKKITFVGNEKISDMELKSDPRMFTKEAGFFSFMSSSGSFKQEAFDNDLQVLKYVYWNQGFLQVKIDRPLVSVTPDKKSIYVTYHIEEGSQYNVGEVDFAGDLLFPKSELYDTVKIKENKVFSVDIMRKDINALQAKYGDLGYAFANPIPRYVFHEQEKTVDLIFEMEKGQKVYFGDIIVTGNTKTRDKVIRRELKIEEGELYNETRRRESLENIQRLGFFDEVNFKTSTPPEKPDQLNIEVVIKERNTGQIQLTAAYGNTQGLSLGGSVIQNNFRGLGQALEARIDASKNRQDYKISLTDPYFRDTKWSAGFDVFYLENQERINYDIRKTGGNIRFGHPVYGDYTRAFFRYKLDKTGLFGNKNTDPLIFPLETAQGVTSSGTLTLEYDTRNDRFSPSKGIYADVSYERTGLGGDLKYQEFSSRFRFFHNLFWDVVWRNNLSYSNIQSLEKGGTVPFSETYQLGGPYTLRGFGSGSIGRRVFSQLRYEKLADSSVDNPFYRPGITDEERVKLSNLIVGGTKQVLFQSELQYPLIKEAGLTGVFFYDIGQAEDEVNTSNFLSDFGLGFRWMSPLGLLRFEWGWPLQKDAYSSDSVNFEFSIGPPF